MRLDHGAAEVRVAGWIPVRATVDLWTDDDGAATAYGLPARTGELLHVPGHRVGPGAGITVAVHPDAGPAHARGRGRDLRVPHHVEVHIVLGDDAAKERVYAESVRAALTDLVSAAGGGPAPRSGAPEARAAVAVAHAASRAAAEGRHVTDFAA
jgi:hypothetical protein